MFLEKYIDRLYFEQIIKKYNEEYLNIIDENKFLSILKILGKYNMYFINDIALSYIEIFEMEPKELDNKLNNLKEKYGEYFNVKIGNDLTLLEELFEGEKDE